MSAEMSTRPRWGLLDAVGSLLGFVVLSFGVALGLNASGVDPVTATIVATPVGWLALLGWPVLATRNRGNGVRTDLDLAFRPVDLGYGLLAAFVVFGAALVFIVAYSGATGGDIPTSTFGDVAEASQAGWQLGLLALTALAAAVVEELHFRGLWWRALVRRGVAPWLTLLLTSLLFSVVHLELTRAPLLFAAGLAAGFVRLRTGRLGPAIITHLCVNGVGALGLLTLL